MTEELLERLLASNDVEAFLDVENVASRNFLDYATQLLREKSIKRAAVVRVSGINATVVYDYFAGKSRPGRDHAIMLAFGLGCTLRETQRLLRSAEVSELWPKQRRDAIIIWCIQNGFSREQCDDELWRLGEKTLFGSGKLSS